MNSKGIKVKKQPIYWEKNVGRVRVYWGEKLVRFCPRESQRGVGSWLDRGVNCSIFFRVWRKKTSLVHGWVDLLCGWNGLLLPYSCTQGWSWKDHPGRRTLSFRGKSSSQPTLCTKRMTWSKNVHGFKGSGKWSGTLKEKHWKIRKKEVWGKGMWMDAREGHKVWKFCMVLMWSVRTRLPPTLHH